MIGRWHQGPQTLLPPPCVAGSAGVVVMPLRGIALPTVLAHYSTGSLFTNLENDYTVLTVCRPTLYANQCPRLSGTILNLHLMGVRA